MMRWSNQRNLAKHAYLEERVDQDIRILLQLDNRCCCLGLDFLQSRDVQLGSMQRGLQWWQLIIRTVQGLDSFPDLQYPSDSQ